MRRIARCGRASRGIAPCCVATRLGCHSSRGVDTKAGTPAIGDKDVIASGAERQGAGVDDVPSGRDTVLDARRRAVRACGYNLPEHRFAPACDDGKSVNRPHRSTSGGVREYEHRFERGAAGFHSDFIDERFTRGEHERECRGDRRDTESCTRSDVTHSVNRDMHTECAVVVDLLSSAARSTTRS